MKNNKLTGIYLFYFKKATLYGVFLSCCSCTHMTQQHVQEMTGKWYCEQRDDSLFIAMSGENFTVTQYKTTNQDTLSKATYPLVYDEFCPYFKAGNSIILLLYNSKDSSLFVSPGGKYSKKRNIGRSPHTAAPDFFHASISSTL